jgi:hypothetical protein
MMKQTLWVDDLIMKSEMSSCWNSEWRQWNSHERFSSNVQSKECFSDEWWVNMRMSQQQSQRTFEVKRTENLIRRRRNVSDFRN